VRIHLGHHFYGAGNLGDDFMVAGFLAAMRTHAPGASFTCCVPFAIEPLRRRFPDIAWLPNEDRERERCITECDVWLGMGGSPFQISQSRWFIDHLVAEARFCHDAGKPMYFLGVGVQSLTELADVEVRRLCSHAAGIWTRDDASAVRLRTLPTPPPVHAAADMAHVFFRNIRPPPAKPRRLTFVANFNYGQWPGQTAGLDAMRQLPATECIWLVQESRQLPGAERELHADLPPVEKARWQLFNPELPGASLEEVLARWPSGEWLVTARYHAAIAGAWAGSKIVVLSTNEKLRAAAHETHAPLLATVADEAAVRRALEAAKPAVAPLALAERAHAACGEFVRSAVAHRR
jgi:polysaccharide pyruvyl transferase WcaK-like protein